MESTLQLRNNLFYNQQFFDNTINFYLRFMKVEWTNIKCIPKFLISQSTFVATYRMYFNITKLRIFTRTFMSFIYSHNNQLLFT
jgi:hypothetical protein